MDFKKFLKALNSEKVHKSVEEQTSYSPEMLEKAKQVLDKPADILRAGIYGAQESGWDGAKDAALAQLNPNAPKAPEWNSILEKQGISPELASMAGAGLGIVEPSLGSKAKVGMKAVEGAEKKVAPFVAERLKILYNKNKDKWNKAAENSPGLKATLEKIKNVQPVGKVVNLAKEPETGTVLNFAKPSAESTGKVILKQPEIQKNFGKVTVKKQADGQILILDENGNVLKALKGATTIGSK